MPESPDAVRMLEMAEQAASVGDLVTADRLLREVARAQEAELGPAHPELANTLNNLGIVAERIGRPRDAEAFYRRAAAIAAEALPPDHPAVAASRQNLEDFCFASGLPLDAPAFMRTLARDAELGLAAFADEDGEAEKEGDEAEAQPDPTPLHASAPEVPAIEALSVEPPPVEPPPVEPPPAEPPPIEHIPEPIAHIQEAVTDAHEPVASQPLLRDPIPERPGPRGVPLSPGLMAIGVAALLTVALFATRPWSSRGAPSSETAAPSTSATPPPTVSTAPAAKPPGTPTSRESARGAPAPAPNTVTEEPIAPVTADGMSLATAQLCQSFTPSGSTWGCDPIREAASPGQIALYTRVRTARDGVVVHRWYHDDTLVKSVKLSIRANATEGYRTYSRQVVSADGAWRVEVTTADGDLLHQQRFSVR